MGLIVRGVGVRFLLGHFFFFEGFLFYAHPSIGSFQHLVIGAYYRLKNVSPYDGRPTTRTKTLYVR